MFFGGNQERHYLTDKEPTELGELINELYDVELDDWYFRTDRGYYPSIRFWSFLELKKYYKGDGEREFQIGVSYAWPEKDVMFTRIGFFHSVFDNEIHYYLMKEHGVSFEAAFKFLLNQTIQSGNCYNPIFLNRTLRNIREKLNYNPVCEILCEKIKHLYELTYQVKERNFLFEPFTYN